MLASCFLCGTKATLSFSAGLLYSSFSAGACAILHALCWSRQHQQVCHFSSLFLLSDSRPVLATLSSPHLSFYLKLSGRSGRNRLLSPPVLSGYQWVPGHLFLSGNDPADELASVGALVAPSAIPCSLSSLISRIHSCLFSNWRRTVSSKFFDTQVPSISTEELVLPRHDRYVLSRLCCNGHSLLLSLISLGLAELRILHAAPADIRPRTPLILFCTVQLRTLCAAFFWRFFVSLRPLVQTLGIWPASGASWSSAMPPSLGRGRVTTTATTSKSITRSLYVRYQ